MFERIEVPVPFQIGSVNTYLCAETIIDPGPDSQAAWEALTNALEERGRSISEFERVLITHPHPDHFGLAAKLRDHGLSIVAHEQAAAIIEDFSGHLVYEQDYFREFFPQHGLGADVTDTVVELPEAFLEFAPDAPVDRRVVDGDTISLGNEATVSVEEVAGHAPGEVLYTVNGADGRHAVVGDHVLDPITPNPFLQPPPTPEGDRPRVLPAYNQSLDRLAQQSFQKFHPGHREVITSPIERVEQLRRFHDHRTERVKACINGPTTAAEIMRDLFDDPPVTEVYPAMSEAIGHLDELEARGEVRRQVIDGEVHYVLA